MESVSMERQQALGLYIPDSVIVVGCGGVGSWVALMLAMAGVKKIWLFDSDLLEGHNLNRIPLPASAIGKAKSIAIGELIASVRPDCSVMALGMFSVRSAGLLHPNATHVVCATDSLRSRKMVYDWALGNGLTYVEVAAEGEQGSATGVPAEWSTPGEDRPGYQSVPVWVGPCVFAAGIAVAHVLHDQAMGDRTIRLGWGRVSGGDDGTFELFDSAPPCRMVNTDSEDVPF